jgi:hypothetical protein
VQIVKISLSDGDVSAFLLLLIKPQKQFPESKAKSNLKFVCSTNREALLAYRQRPYCALNLIEKSLNYLHSNGKSLNNQDARNRLVHESTGQDDKRPLNLQISLTTLTVCNRPTLQMSRKCRKANVVSGLMKD